MLSCKHIADTVPVYCNDCTDCNAYIIYLHIYSIYTSTYLQYLHIYIIYVTQILISAQLLLVVVLLLLQTRAQHHRNTCCITYLKMKYKYNKNWG